MWEFPNIISATLIQKLVAEGLLKYSFGDPKLTFSVPLYLFDVLDIFYTFRWQDLMGLSITGVGEAGRYYYIESMDYDFMGDKMNVVAIDLQYFLRRHFLLGDETVLASNWSAASEPDKMFGYLCDGLRFDNGDPGKSLSNEGNVGGY